MSTDLDKFCEYCKKQRAQFRMYHRDGSETLRCDECKNPDTVRSISKIGLEFKNDYKINVKVEQ